MSYNNCKSWYIKKWGGGGLEHWLNLVTEESWHTYRWFPQSLLLLDSLLIVGVMVWVQILNACLAELKRNMYIKNTEIHQISNKNLMTIHMNLLSNNSMHQTWVQYIPLCSLGVALGDGSWIFVVSWADTTKLPPHLNVVFDKAWIWIKLNII